MDEDTHIPNPMGCEDPKSLLRRLPRRVPKAVHLGEDPKAFLRRLARRAQMQVPNSGGAADAQ